MNSFANPLSPRNIIAGVIIAVIGGVILNYVLRALESPPTPPLTPALTPTLEMTPTMPSRAPTLGATALNPVSSPQHMPTVQPGLPTSTPLLSKKVTVSHMPLQNLDSIWNRTSPQFSDLYQAGTRTYEATAHFNEQLRWGFDWCAIDESTLQNILAPFSASFQVDDVAVSDELIEKGAKTNKDGWQCQTWDMALNNWRQGSTVELRIHYNLTRSINDGLNSFPPGEYNQVIKVTIQ
jgi:hypothetical protein